MQEVMKPVCHILMCHHWAWHFQCMFSFVLFLCHMDLFCLALTVAIDYYDLPFHLRCPEIPFPMGAKLVQFKVQGFYLYSIFIANAYGLISYLVH